MDARGRKGWRLGQRGIRTLTIKRDDFIGLRISRLNVKLITLNFEGPLN